MIISVRDEYDDAGSLTLWSGGFASDFEGWATPLTDGSGYHIELKYGETVDVITPMRGDNNWMKVDDTINAAVPGRSRS